MSDRHHSLGRRTTAIVLRGLVGIGCLAAMLPCGPIGSAAAIEQVATTGGGCTDPNTRIPQSPPALTTLQSSLSWTINRGEGVVVAVVDSGVAASNPHLDGVLAGGTDLVDDGTGNSGYADANGHGTAIAGQIAAQAIPGSGVRGLAPEARILSVRVFANTDDQTVAAGRGPSITRLAAGIRYAADADAQIINVSLSTAIDDPALRAATEYATERGSLIVASTGNRDTSLALDKDQQDGVRYPAGYPGVIGVSATGTNGVVTDSSIHGSHVALSAPGQDVLTAASSGGDCVYAGEKPATSFATGYVSAAAALVASAYPEETPAQWAYRLTAAANRAHPDTRDDISGWGTVQPYEALSLVPGPQTRGPVSPFTQAAEQQRPAESGAVRIEHNNDLAARQAAAALVIGLVGATVLATLAILTILATRRRALVRSE